MRTRSAAPQLCSGTRLIAAVRGRLPSWSWPWLWPWPYTGMSCGPAACRPARRSSGPGAVEAPFMLAYRFRLLRGLPRDVHAAHVLRWPLLAVLLRLWTLSPRRRARLGRLWASLLRLRAMLLRLGALWGRLWALRSRRRAPWMCRWARWLRRWVQGLRLRVRWWTGWQRLCARWLGV